MSNALAIAAVTAVLKDLLDNGLIDHSVNVAAGDTVEVTAVAPDHIDTGKQEKPQLNLFLYQVQPNIGWRNVDLPSRDGRGDRLTNPPLALDLYYLLTAYGKSDFVTEILLGYAMQLLHETPVLARDAIRKTLEPPWSVEDAVLPPALRALADSDLADQVELIKICPHSLGTEEISKLWAAFQTSYRPTVAYKASVVLIESEHPVRSPLPVLSRGQPDPTTGRDEGVVVQPDLAMPGPPFPTIETILPPQEQIAVRLGEVLTILGHHLDGTTVTARLAHPLWRDQDPPYKTLPATVQSATEITVELPDAPTVWPAGFYTLAVVVEESGQLPQTTNELTFSLAPELTNVPTTVARDAEGDVELTLTCKPRVGEEQRASLFLGDREAAAEPRTAPTDTLVFPITDAPPGEHWVRLRVDGVESLLIDRSTRPPTFVTSQKVTIT